MIACQQARDPFSQMCTFSPWNPFWSVAAKRCGTTPGTVWAIVAAIREDDGMLPLLKPHDRVRVLARLGIKVQIVALVVAALEEAGIVADGRISERWAELDPFSTDSVLIASERLNQTPQTPDDERQRLLRSARNRRYYRKRKGLPGDRPLRDLPESKTLDRLNQSPPSLEEREQDQLFSSDAQGRVKPAVGWGVQAEADKKARAERWLSNVMHYARERMSQSDWARLWAAGMQEPRPRWAQAQLDEWSRRMKADKERPPPSRPDPKQPEMLMPIATSKAALSTGVRPDWNERMVKYQRMVGG